jgi:hypothetical protein
MDTEIYLPKNFNESSVDLVIFRCANYFGNVLGHYYNERMHSLGEPDWLQKLAVLRQDYKINLVDPTFVLKEPLHSDSPLRQFLPKSPTFFNNLSALKKLRNKVFHNDFRGDISQAIAAVELFFQASLEIGLDNAAKQFSNLLQRLREIEAGIFFEEKSDIHNIHDSEELLILEDKLSELGERMAESRNRTIELEAELKAKVRDLEEQIALASKNQSEVARLKELLKEKEYFSEKLIQERIRERANYEDFESERMQLKGVAELISKMDLNENQLVNLLMGSNATNLDIEEVNRLQHVSNWSRKRGNRKLVLSVKSRDLLDPQTNIAVEGLSAGDRKLLAESWLRVRPTGGRIFVDHEGNVTTLIGEDLVWLGVVEELAAK